MEVQTTQYFHLANQSVLNPFSFTLQSNTKPFSCQVQAVVSGLFTSSFALGNFCGPTVSGIMYDLITFKNNAIILQVLVAIVFLMNVVCALLKSNPTPYTYISSSHSVPELPDRRDSGGFSICILFFLKHDQSMQNVYKSTLYREKKKTTEISSAPITYKCLIFRPFPPNLRIKSQNVLMKCCSFSGVASGYNFATLSRTTDLCSFSGVASGYHQKPSYRGTASPQHKTQVFFLKIY